LVARFPVATGALLVSLLTLAFAPGLTGPFLLDDWGNLDPLLNVRLDLSSIYGAVFNNPSGLLHRPISNLTFVLNLLATGLDPLVFKLTNLVIHAATGVVVYFVTLQILSTVTPGTSRHHRQLTAAIASALWLVHPLHVSTVLYVVQRMAMLSAFFSLIAVGAALSAINGEGVRQTSSTAAIGLFLVASALAVLSKENGVLTPLLLAAVLIVAPKESNGPATATRRVLWIALVFAPIALGLCAMAWLWSSVIDGFTGRHFSMAERLLTQPAILTAYVGSIFFPVPSGMALFRDDTAIRHATDWSTWFFVALWTLALVSAIRLRHRHPLAAFSILWFLACHALESSFLPLELAFEHRNYLALLGPAILVGSLLVKCSAAMSRLIAAAIIALPVITLCWLTFSRADDWSSEESFARTEVAHRPDSIRAQNLMAIIERRAGDTEAPVRRMARMKVLYPDQFFPWAMDMDFACDLPGHAVDWERVKANALRSPGSPEVLGYFNHIALKVMGGSCAGIGAAELDQQLAQLGEVTRLAGSIRASQYFLLLRASLRESSDAEAARALFQSALSLTPDAADVLERVILFELRHGTKEEALTLLERLLSQTPATSPRHPRVMQLGESVRSMTDSD
jgi:hypothetical protein